MSDKKKKVTAVVAVATATALFLGGTFAWQSISQTALNEKDAVINPGGRLHDDFNGSNKDVYVENFADEPIFARVRLDEYFEITMNKNTPAETTEVITTGASKDDKSSYLTHYFDQTNLTDEYWDWATGGSTKYMPTFNKNKDSLKADINGTYENDYVDYSQITDLTKDAIYDIDSNNIEDDGVQIIEETHSTNTTEDGTLISMSEWLDMYSEGQATDNYWVYDTDGWVYWSSPIQAGTATGLLLDGISLKNKMDDSYYYAINVTGQFVTADDVGQDDNTGFYDTEAGTAPSENAETLLRAIGVDMGEEVVEEPLLAVTVIPDNDYYLTGGTNTTINLSLSATYDSNAVSLDDITSVVWKVEATSGDLNSGTTLTSTTGTSNSLFVMGLEESDIKVTATVTYNDETVDGVCWISNGPPVSGYVMYGSDGVALRAVDSYVVGNNTYELCFFANYMGGIDKYNKADAYTGELQKYLAKDLSWTLVDDDWQETTAEGVTVKADENNPALVTVTIPEGFNQKIQLGCKDDGEIFLSNGLVLQPTSATFDFSGGNATCEDNGTDINITVSDATYISMNVTSPEHLDAFATFSFSELTVSDGYSVTPLNKYGEIYTYIHSNDVSESDLEYNYLVSLNENSISVNDLSILSENVVITGKVTANIYGTDFTRNITITLQKPDI